MIAFWPKFIASTSSEARWLAERVVLVHGCAHKWEVNAAVNPAHKRRLEMVLINTLSKTFTNGTDKVLSK
jgi:hypothetical protein